jgi:hypothetical protein
MMKKVLTNCFAVVNSFSRGKRPPYILLLQMDQTKGRSQLAEFYDSVFARHCSQASDKMVASPSTCFANLNVFVCKCFSGRRD